MISYCVQDLERQWRIRGHDVRVILCGYWRQKIKYFITEPLVQASIAIYANSIDVACSSSEVKWTCLAVWRMISIDLLFQRIYLLNTDSLSPFQIKVERLDNLAHTTTPNSVTYAHEHWEEEGDCGKSGKG